MPANSLVRRWVFRSLKRIQRPEKFRYIFDPMLSRFLPENYDPQKTRGAYSPVGSCIRSSLPSAFASNAIPLKLIAFHGETREDLIESFPASDRMVIKVGQLGRMLKALKKFEAGYALMAGQITPKRLFRGLHPDLKAIRILASLREKNADTIFGAIASEIEQIGVVQLDARALLDSELAQAGPNGGKTAQGRTPLHRTRDSHCPRKSPDSTSAKGSS